jgi:phosphonopyruvate decarboxylase
LFPAEEFWRVLKGSGYKLFSGVPCSILSNILNCALDDPDIKYIPAVRENAALGIASGAYLAGRKSGILIQNSGLGNIINTLTSFNLIYKIPVLMFITWRGHKGKDAPEHLIMGEKMPGLLKQLEIPTIVLSTNCKEKILNGIKRMEAESVPLAIIIKKGIIQ